MKTANRVNTLNELREERKRLKRKEEFLVAKIKESLNFELRPDGENPLGQISQSILSNPATILNLGTAVLPSGMLKSIMQTIGKFSWLIPVLKSVNQAYQPQESDS